MLELKPYQTEAVDALLKNVLKQLAQPGRQQKLVFKAPTGAGKTVTMAALLNKLCEERPNLAFIWLAPNQLHYQSFRAMSAYFAELRSIRPIYFEDITEGQLQPAEVLFLNWQSVSAEKNIFIRSNEQGRTLSNYIDAARASGVEIVAILDEAHLFASKGDKAKKLLAEIKAKIEIDVSATPFFTSDYQSTIPRADVVAAEMIKKGISLNPAIDAAQQGGESLTHYLLEQALSKRQQLADSYAALGVKINPLLLIQLPNDGQQLNDLDKKIKDEIIASLEHRPNNPMSVQNRRLAVWLSNDKQNLDGIEKANGFVDVLLFKQAIALGWDCPRAAVLLIFRELKQETFTIQTVGRILRMPEQRHYVDPALNYGYVYTNLSRNQIQVVQDDLDYIMEQKAFRIENYEILALPSIYINTRIIRNRLGARFRRDCFFAASVEYFELRDPKELTESESPLYYNAEQLKRKMIQTEVSKIEIPIPRDVELTGEMEGVSAPAIERFARTPYELSRMLDRFSFENLGGYAKKESYEILKSAMIRFFNDYLGFDEFTATKIILAPHNRAQWREVVENALKKHDKLLQEKAANAAKTVVDYEWDVPSERAYNERYKPQPNTAHALKEFFEAADASGVERRFVAFLENNRQYLHWWYKNGEKNKEDFAVMYTDQAGVTRTFYVDFVICLKNKVICLFDTKTLGSDPEFCNKHNALIAYIINLNAERSTKYFGGVIVPVGKAENEVWKYSPKPIVSAQDATDWQIFNPALLANEPQNP